MRDNDIDRSRLNHRQEIVLAGASFDDDTKSAATWMAKYGLPFRVIELQPIKVADQYFLNVNQLIPPSEYEDFYVDLVAVGNGHKTVAKTVSGGRKTRIRLNAIMAAGKVSVGDEISFKPAPAKKARLLDAKRCQYKDEEMTILNWARDMSGWSSVNIYDWVTHVPSSRLLGEIRRELEEEQEQQQAMVNIEASNGSAESNEEQNSQEGSSQ